MMYNDNHSLALQLQIIIYATYQYELPTESNILSIRDTEENWRALLVRLYQHEWRYIWWNYNDKDAIHIMKYRMMDMFFLKKMKKKMELEKCTSMLSLEKKMLYWKITERWWWSWYFDQRIWCITTCISKIAIKSSPCNCLLKKKITKWREIGRS